VVILTHSYPTNLPSYGSSVIQLPSAFIEAILTINIRFSIYIGAD